MLKYYECKGLPKYYLFILYDYKIILLKKISLYYQSCVYTAI
jgi:hypothetical protein